MRKFRIHFLYLTACSLLSCVTKPVTQDGFYRGQSLLEQSKALEENSRAKILEASQLRKKLKTLHQEKMKVSQDQRSAINLKLADLKTSMISLRKDGARLRTSAKQSKNEALAEFKGGMIETWGQWIQHQGPLGLAGEAPMHARAHNPKIASSSPKFFKPLMPESNDGYQSILSTIPDEQNAPEDLDISSFQISRKRTMVAHIEPAPLNGAKQDIPLNKIHNWYFVVSDLEGQPVDDDFLVEGHMPGHVHGLPTQPVVTKKLAPGVYLIEGVKFQMQGWWVMELLTEDDRVRFNVVL